MINVDCPARGPVETHCDHWWDNSGPCCACGDDSHDEDEEDHGERALPFLPLDSSLLCPGCYSVVPPPGVRILIDSTDPAYPSPVTTVFCSAMCAETTATREGFLRG